MEGKKKALIISISDYEKGLENLDFCRNDGEEMYTTLRDLGYQILDNQKIVGKSDQKTIQNAMIDFFEDDSVQPSDTLLFYFSGHGVIDGFGGRFFANTDVTQKRPQRDGVRFGLLNEEMSNSIAGKKIAILDCCFSGAAEPDRFGKSADTIEEEAEKLGRQNLGEAFDNASTGEGSCILASSLSNKRSYALKDEKFSAFTSFIIEGLKGTKGSVDENGFVTPERLSEFVSTEMRKRPELQNQTPVRNTSVSGTFILAEHKHLRTKDLPYQELLDEQALIDQGSALYNLGKYKEAITCYDKALEMDPNNIGALTLKGMTLDSQGNYLEAITCFDKALEIDPKNVDSWIWKGEILDRLGNHQNAITCYDKALEADPLNIGALNSKGTILGKQGDYQDAITCYDKALEIDPNDFYALTNKAVALNILGDIQGAITCYDKALEIIPKDVYALNSKGTILYTIGNFQDAITCYDKALEEDPQNVDALKGKKRGSKCLVHLTGVQLHLKIPAVNDIKRCPKWYQTK